ncbi:MAG TPA: hypothetical protein VLE20_15880 [Blastocatellia bacterium]|nr:hypothetical protein [Blastocatellia bacterium]
MRTDSVRYLAVAAMMFTVTAACNDHGNAANTSNTNARGSSDGGSANVAVTPENGTSPLVTLPEEADEALILRPIRDVWMKVKGAQAFIRIISSTPFRSGDTLRIGEDSKAVIFCKDVCELTTGTYTACCTDACILAVPIARNATAGPPMMLIKDLPPDEQLTLADSESRLQALGLGETTTRFLKASLYSSWRLKEAEGELAALSAQLEKPEATTELDKAYSTVTRRTGDLFVTINQKEKAVREYERTIKPPPQAVEWQPGLLDEKAIAHQRIGDVYAESGNKEEAEANFKAAKSIYVMRGETAKAQEIDRKMRVKKQ